MRAAAKVRAHPGFGVTRVSKSAAPVLSLHRLKAVEVRARTVASPAEQERAALAALNARKMNSRAGRWYQRFAHNLVLNYLFGPVARALLHTLFRLRIEGGEIVDTVHDRAIFACRHFYEWDPFITFATVCWPRSIARPWLTPFNTAGLFWARSRLFRVLSWFCGNMVFVPGREPTLGALGVARHLLRTRKRFSVAIYPTGPIGRAKEYHMRYGLGWLARKLPETPIVPITLIGVQELSWKHVLLLKRPVLIVRIGAPIRGLDFHCTSGLETELEGRLLMALREEWERLEGIRDKKSAR
jgi:1-acyl-sn-glycerol-3-phosphate acyltransferase